MSEVKTKHPVERHVRMVVVEKRCDATKNAINFPEYSRTLDKQGDALDLAAAARERYAVLILDAIDAEIRRREPVEEVPPVVVDPAPPPPEVPATPIGETLTIKELADRIASDMATIEKILSIQREHTKAHAMRLDVHSEQIEKLERWRREMATIATDPEHVDEFDDTPGAAPNA